MNFCRAEPTPDYRLLRMVSTCGVWELGLSPYAHGTRIRMGHAGRPPRLLDFCLGHDPQLVLTVLSAILKILSTLPEDSSPQDIDAAFPWAGTRPNAHLHLPALCQQA